MEPFLLQVSGWLEVGAVYCSLNKSYIREANIPPNYPNVINPVISVVFPRYAPTSSRTMH